MYQRPEKIEQAWSGIVMFILVVFSFIIPLVGLCFGIYATYHEPKKVQGYILIAIAIVMIAVNIISLRMSSYY